MIHVSWVGLMGRQLPSTALHPPRKLGELIATVFQITIIIIIIIFYHP